MRRIFLSFFILLVSVQSVFASRTVVTQTPYYNYNNPYLYRQYYNQRRGVYPRSYYNPNFTELSALEKYAFDRSYARENNLDRLQRLEMQAFGAIQQGDFDTRYDNVRNAILSRPKAHTNSSVWRNIGDYFSGQMTGFTPQINTSGNYYTPTFGRSTFVESSSPFGGRTIRTGNYGMSSGTGITILD